MIEVYSKETCIQAIKEIGQELINRAEDISNDVEGVQSINIQVSIIPNEIVNVNVTKNYVVGFKKVN